MIEYRRQTRLRDLIDAESYVWRKLHLSDMADDGWQCAEKTRLIQRLKTIRDEIATLDPPRIVAEAGVTGSAHAWGTYRNHSVPGAAASIEDEAKLRDRIANVEMYRGRP